MDVRVLRYFLAVAQEENITRAAERLHMAQPSLSKQIMALERELGKPLLIRGKRKLRLTEDGVLLRRRAEEIVALLEKTEQEVAASATNLTGEIALGGNATESVLRIAATLRREQPGVRFNLYSSDAIDVEDRLAHGGLDFAVLLEPVDAVKYESVPLPERARWGLLMRRDDPLADGHAIGREALVQEELILHRRPGLQREIARWAHTEPEQLRVAATDNVVSIDPVKLVESGLGSLLVTRDLLPDSLDAGVCFRPLDPPLEIRFALVWKRRAALSRAAQCFMERIKGAFSS